jgi:IS605 OrfB family transposase
MQLTHKIMLKITTEQATYFQKAAGTSRFVWNWALAKWREQYADGKKPNAMALKKLFNAIKYQKFPWLKEMHRDSHAQPFAYLATAWSRFFSEIKANKRAKKKRTAHEIIGVDFGIKSAATLSTGENIASPMPLKSALRRLKMRSRSISRKIKGSNNQKKSILKLSILHARIANLRADFSHQLTTHLCRENQTIVIEDLHVAGMVKNEKLSRALNDVGFGNIRRQLEYKALRYDTKLIIADRWYPSSKLCSSCYWKNDALTLQERSWCCKNCNTLHDRDVNAAINLKRLATETALPVASHSVMNDTGIQITSIPGGKMTPVRYECGQQDTSG